MKKEKWNRKIIVLIAVFLAVVCAVIFFMAFYARQKEAVNQEMGFGEMNWSEGAPTEGMIQTVGTSYLGMQEVAWEVPDGESKLLIEKVLVNSGDTVDSGTEILKFSQESYENVKQELEQAAKRSELDYRKELINYEKGLITAKEELEKTQANGQAAVSVYEKTVLELNQKQKQLEDELADLKEVYEEYIQAVGDAEYYEKDYKVAELERLYQEDYWLMDARMDEWNISERQIAQADNEKMFEKTDADWKWKLSTLALLSKQVEQAKADWEEAETKAEEAYETFQKDYEKTIAQYQAKELELEAFLLTIEEETLKAKTLQEETETEATVAQTTYETAKKKWEESLAVYEYAKAEAADQLETFTNCVKEGYYLATDAGSIAGVMVTKGTKLSQDTLLLVMSITEELFVSASVSQDDIAKVEIADKVQIVTAEGTVAEGIVQEIQPFSSSQSKANVSYSVTVLVTGETDVVEENQSVTVVFGADEVIPSHPESGGTNGKET